MEELQIADVDESGIVPEKKTLKDATTALGSEKFLNSELKGKGAMEEPKTADLEESSAGKGFLPDEKKMPFSKGEHKKPSNWLFSKGKDADTAASGLELKSGLSTDEKLSSMGKLESTRKLVINRWEIEGGSLLELLEERLSKSYRRVVNLVEIKYPFLCSYAVIFWQKIIELHCARAIKFKNEELWRWADILVSLSDAVEDGYILPDQYLCFIKFAFDPAIESKEYYYEDDEIRSILESGLVGKRQKRVSEDKTLVSTQRIEPPKQAPSISELPLYLVPLLAYCSLFPKGHRLVKEKLINLWMAEGFLLSFKKVNVLNDEHDEMGNIGDDCFDELVEKGVFHKCRDIGGRVYDCEIHPLAHDTACQIAGTEVKIIDNNVHRDSMGMNEASYIAFNMDGLQNDDIGRVMTQNSSVRTCLFFGNTDAQSPINLRFITEKSKNLRVLDLYGTHVDELLLPPSRSLRYLGLPPNHGMTNLKGFSCLETLVGDDTSLVEYYYGPQTRMSQLYLTTAQKTLYVGHQLQILELSHCKELNFITFEANHLKQLRIYNCPKLVSLPLYRQERKETDLEELIIDYCISLDFTDSNSFRKQFGRLRYLELIGLPMMVNLPAGLKSASALENFMIVDCPSLKSTAKVLQKLCSLKKLCIYNCPNLLALGECPPSLHTLDIRLCPGLIKSYSTNKGEDWKVMISHIQQIILDGECSMSQESDLSEESRPEFVVESVSYFSLKAQTESTTRRRISELYSNLEEMKFHCLIFPNDYEFERDTLILLWAAAKFFMSSEEEIGLGCFSILLSEGYILLSSVDILTGKSMYRVDVEKIKSQFSGMLEDKAPRYAMLFDCTKEDDLSNAWHVSVVSNRINETTFQLLETITGLKTLKFVLSDYGCSLKQVPYSLFTALPSMQVLDLSKSHITELPSSIGDVRCLRYLDLSFTLIEKLPESIDCLMELQTLKLKGCKQLYTLPKGLKGLMRLVHLEFDEHSRLTCMPKGIGALTQLRTLSAFIVGDTGKDCKINELQSLQNLRGSLSISGLEKVSEVSYQELISDSSITCLQLQWSDFTSNGENVAHKILEGLIPPATIKELQILSFPGSSLSWLFKKGNLAFIERITILKCESLDFNGQLGSLQNLEYLSITQLNRVKKIDKGFRGHLIHVAFPKLEELVIDGMFSLESWTDVNNQDFPLLKKFTLMHCPKLSSLPFLSSIPSLQYLEIRSCEKLEPFTGTLPASLKTLIINDCSLLKSRCSKEGEDWNKIMHVPQIWIDQINIYSPIDDTDDEDESSIAESDDERERFKHLDSLLEYFEEKTDNDTALPIQVRDEVDQTIQRLPHLITRASPTQMETSEIRPYKLKFEKKLGRRFYTDNRVEAEGSAPITIMLLDALSGQPIVDGPLSSKKVEIVALRGHSKAEDLEDLTKEEFCNDTLRERANKRPLLIGKRVIELRNGIGMVDDVCVTDSSSWVPTKMFRLGARMIGEENQVKEAVSTPFEVKHRRGETDQKHPVLSPEDEVWRLEGIARKGKIRKRLEEHNIHKVKDLVLQYHNDQSLLRRILKVSLRKWDKIIQQATSCCCFSGNDCTNQSETSGASLVPSNARCHRRRQFFLSKRITIR